MPGFDQAVQSSAPRSVTPFPESEAKSGTYPCSQRLQEPEPLSERLWGTRLTARLPKLVSSDGVVAVPGELARICEFLAREFPSMREDQATHAPEQIEAKRTFLGELSDQIELRHGDQTVGVLIGAPLDWSSYYVRVLAIVPAFQRPAMARRFVRECLFEPLAAQGVQRIEAETSPCNLAMSRMLLELQFHCTGQQLSERWGPMVRYTKFLDPACEKAFHRRFAGTAPPCSIGTRKEETP
jgi:hypothetical protein